MYSGQEAWLESASSPVSGSVALSPSDETLSFIALALERVMTRDVGAATRCFPFRCAAVNLGDNLEATSGLTSIPRSLFSVFAPPAEELPKKFSSFWFKISLCPRHNSFSEILFSKLVCTAKSDKDILSEVLKFFCVCSAKDSLCSVPSLSALLFTLVETSKLEMDSSSQAGEPNDGPSGLPINSPASVLSPIIMSARSPKLESLSPSSLAFPSSSSPLSTSLSSEELLLSSVSRSGLGGRGLRVRLISDNPFSSSKTCAMSWFGWRNSDWPSLVSLQSWAGSWLLSFCLQRRNNTLTNCGRKCFNNKSL